MKLYSSSFLPITMTLLRMEKDAFKELKEFIINISINIKEENLLSNIKFCRILYEGIKDGNKEAGGLTNY